MEVDDEYVQSWIAEQLLEAPPLTDAQRRRLGRLLAHREEELVDVDERYL